MFRMSRLACRGILFELKKTGFSTMAKSDESWDKQTEVARGVISGLGDKAPCRFSAAFAVNAVIGTGNSTAWPGDATDIYATSYATLLERTARALFDQGSDRYYIPGDRFDLPSLSSDDAADIVPSVENTTWDDEGGCFSVARRVHRLHVLERIRDAVLEKKERDAAVAREAARVRRIRCRRCHCSQGCFRKQYPPGALALDRSPLSFVPYR